MLNKLTSICDDNFSFRTVNSSCPRPILSMRSPIHSTPEWDWISDRGLSLAFPIIPLVFGILLISNKLILQSGTALYSMNCIHYFQISPHFTDQRRRSDRRCIQSQYSLRIVGRRVLRAHWSTVSDYSYSDHSIACTKTLCDLWPFILSDHSHPFSDYWAQYQEIGANWYDGKWVTFFNFPALTKSMMQIRLQVRMVGPTGAVTRNWGRNARCGEDYFPDLEISGSEFHSSS